MNDSTNINLKQLSDAWVVVTYAILECVNHLVPKCMEHIHYGLMTHFGEEIKARNLPTITVDDDILEKPPGLPYGSPMIEWAKSQPPPDESFSIYDEGDDYVKFWWALAAEVEDFSSLGWGIRYYVDELWRQANFIIKDRKIKREFFCDLEKT